MSLAEELLADLEDGDDSELYDVGAVGEEKMDVDADPGKDTRVLSVREVCKLRDSDRFKQVKEALDRSEEQKLHPTRDDIMGPVEADPEYQLIVNANTLAVDIDNEISTVHKFTRDKYTKRFPELESLVVSPLEYLKTVRELGNNLDKAKNNQVLSNFLTQATIMVVSVTASTTQGQTLSEEELAVVYEACDMAMELNEFKFKIYAYVESRMTFIAPNLSAIVGAETAAKLMGIAGGLTKLSKIPACNVLVLGSQKKVLGGFSQTAMLPHTGFVYYCPLVQDQPPDMRRKAARLVAAKSALAARVDASHQSSDGRIGKNLREEIEKKLDKLQEPPPVKSIKALPKPVDPPKKRRGGKRVRKMKERYAVTEMRKQANRITFGDIGEDAYQQDLGYSRGQMGKTGSGKVRMAQVDEKTKVRISKTLQRNLQKQQVYGGATTVRKHISGTASSVAFTPLQGLEIVNPGAAEKKVNEANAKYFSKAGTFINVNKSSGSGAN